MKKRDIFFWCLFIVVFMICATVMAGDFLCKQVEKGMINNQKQAGKECIAVSEGSEESNLSQNTICKDLRTDDMEGQEVEKAPKNAKEAEYKEGKEDNGEQENSGEMKEYPIDVEEKEPMEEMQSTDMVEYFTNALFIGDSRTVGLMEYGNIENADFFADTGMTAFDLEKEKIYVQDIGKVGLDELLDSKKYEKIYLMLGINELGYRFEHIQEKYEGIVEKLRESQGDAVIYLCANLHVTREQSQKDEIYNNENIDRVNEMICKLADNENIFYIDVNELFDDDSGSLSTDYSSDAFHVYGKYYLQWVDWLCSKMVEVRERD